MTLRAHLNDITHRLCFRSTRFLSRISEARKKSCSRKEEQDKKSDAGIDSQRDFQILRRLSNFSPVVFCQQAAACGS